MRISKIIEYDLQDYLYNEKYETIDTEKVLVSADVYLEDARQDSLEKGDHVRASELGALQFQLSLTGVKDVYKLKEIDLKFGWNGEIISGKDNDDLLLSLDGNADGSGQG